MSLDSRLFGRICLFVLSVAMAGCGYDRPRLQGPGTIQQQQLGAALHDPYTDPNMGPEVVGGRPREFQKPLPEPVRNRGLKDPWWQR